MKNKTEKEFDSIIDFNFDIEIPFHKILRIFKKLKKRIKNNSIFI